MRHKIKTIMDLGLNAVLPPRCVMTGDIVQHQGTLSPKAWSGIDFIRDPMCQRCGVPFSFEMEENGDNINCASCLDYPPPYQSARAAIKYNDHSRDLILGFKHADQMHAVASFMPWLKMAGVEMLQEADAMIPVPLHRWRLLKRRYNQAAVIAQYLGKECGLPVLHQGLVRTRPTPTQGHLNHADRAKNVKRAFAVHPKYAAQITGKTFVLIDDVYTTGSTAKECTKMLLKAGAAKVHVLTLARVVRLEG